MTQQILYSTHSTSSCLVCQGLLTIGCHESVTGTWNTHNMAIGTVVARNWINSLWHLNWLLGLARQRWCDDCGKTRHRLSNTELCQLNAMRASTLFTYLPLDVIWKLRNIINYYIILKTPCSGRNKAIQ